MCYYYYMIQPKLFKQKDAKFICPGESNKLAPPVLDKIAAIITIIAGIVFLYLFYPLIEKVFGLDEFLAAQNRFLLIGVLAAFVLIVIIFLYTKFFSSKELLVIDLAGNTITIDKKTIPIGEITRIGTFSIYKFGISRNGVRFELANNAEGVGLEGFKTREEVEDFVAQFQEIIYRQLPVKDVSLNFVNNYTGNR